MVNDGVDLYLVLGLCSFIPFLVCIFLAIRQDIIQNKMNKKYGHKCDTCQKRHKIGNHEILHGFGPESDSWIETVCNDCFKNKYVSRFSLTQHILS